jgi:hypothetical protein
MVSTSSGMSGSQNACSPAQAAFNKALGLVRADQPSAIPLDWFDNIHTIDDVKKEVQKAQDKYISKPKSELRKWLGRISPGIMHYARVLDVLAQQHPEYVSLAWGMMKVMFIVGNIPPLGTMVAC